MTYYLLLILLQSQFQAIQIFRQALTDNRIPIPETAVENIGQQLEHPLEDFTQVHINCILV